MEMTSPRKVNNVHRFTGRIVTFKCLHFNKILKGAKDLIWTEECEEAFILLKAYLSSPPLLSKPMVEEMLLLYLVVSGMVVNAALVQEEGIM